MSPEEIRTTLRAMGACSRRQPDNRSRDMRAPECGEYDPPCQGCAVVLQKMAAGDPVACRPLLRLLRGRGQASVGDVAAYAASELRPAGAS